MKRNHRTPFSGGDPSATAIGKLGASTRPEILPSESHRRNVPTVQNALNPITWQDRDLARAAVSVSAAVALGAGAGSAAFRPAATGISGKAARQLLSRRIRRALAAGTETQAARSESVHPVLGGTCCLRSDSRHPPFAGHRPPRRSRSVLSLEGAFARPGRRARPTPEPSEHSHRSPKTGCALAGLCAVPSVKQLARPAAPGKALETPEPDHDPLGAIAMMELAVPMSGQATPIKTGTHDRSACELHRQCRQAELKQHALRQAENADAEPASSACEHRHCSGIRAAR